MPEGDQVNAEEDEKKGIVDNDSTSNRQGEGECSGKCEDKEEQETGCCGGGCCGA